MACSFLAFLFELQDILVVLRCFRDVLFECSFSVFFF